MAGYEASGLFQFNAKDHREFDESTRTAVARSLPDHALSFAFQNEGELGHLLDTDFAVINGLLGAHYGIKDVKGDQFRKSVFPQDLPAEDFWEWRIHAMGSDGMESSPVERGAWVLRHLVHNPPPPAPANVPQISRLDGKPLTKRQKLAAHMEEASVPVVTGRWTRSDLVWRILRPQVNGVKKKGVAKELIKSIPPENFITGPL